VSRYFTFRKSDNLLGHLTLNEKEGLENSRSFHQYKNSSNFNFEHSEAQIKNFRKEHTSRNIMAGFSKTMSKFKQNLNVKVSEDQQNKNMLLRTSYNDFSGFGQIVPKHVKQRDATPGMRFFGMASGYSPMRKTIEKDYELSPNFSIRKKRPIEMTNLFSSSILI
jgi:hypothetical protein